MVINVIHSGTIIIIIIIITTTTTTTIIIIKVKCKVVPVL
jgi:hypothetical protein